MPAKSPDRVVQAGEDAIGGLNDQLVRLGVHLKDFVCVPIECHRLRPVPDEIARRGSSDAQASYADRRLRS